MPIENGDKAWDLLMARLDRIDDKLDKLTGLPGRVAFLYWILGGLVVGAGVAAAKGIFG